MDLKKGWVDRLVFDKIKDEQPSRKRFRAPSPGSDKWNKSAKRGSGRAQVRHNLDTALGKVEDEDV